MACLLAGTTNSASLTVDAGRKVRVKKFNLLGTDTECPIGLETVDVAVEPFYDKRGFYAPPSDVIITDLHWLPDACLYCVGADINLDRVDWWAIDLDLPSEAGFIQFVTMEPVTRKEPGRWLRVDVHAKLLLNGREEALKRIKALSLRVIREIGGCDRDGDERCQLILRDKFGNTSHTV